MKLKAYQDKGTGLWKWGTRGRALYDSKQEAERAGLDLLVAGLVRARERYYRELVNYGK